MRVLDDSLRECGAGRSILADRDGTVVCGNKTLERAADIGLPVRVVQTNGTELVVVQRTDLDLGGDDGQRERARRLAYFDNRASELGLAFDAEQILADLEAGVNLEGLWRDDELTELLAGLVEPEAVADPGAQLSKADELQEKWQVETGDVWQCGRHRICCGDCTDAAVVEKVMEGERAGAVVTDPPYSSGGLYAGQRRQKVSSKYKQTESKRVYFDFSGDNRDQRSWIQWCSLWLAALQSVCELEAYLMVFCDWRQIPALTDAVQVAGWLWRGVNVWDKTEGSRMAHQGYFRAQAEFVVWGTHGQLSPKYTEGGSTFPGVFTCPVDSDKVHLTQKPVAVLEWLVGITLSGCVVLDPFLGSGTTLVACQRLARRGRGIEIHAPYVSVCLERLSGMGLDCRKVEGA